MDQLLVEPLQKNLNYELNFKWKFQCLGKCRKLFTWLSSKKCVARSSYCFGLMHLRATSFLFGLTCVSFVHRKQTMSLVFYDNPSSFFFLQERAHCDTPRVWREWQHSMAHWMSVLLIPIMCEIVLILGSCVLATASSKTTL
jgi:hypothetical protein